MFVYIATIENELPRLWACRKVASNATRIPAYSSASEATLVARAWQQLMIPMTNSEAGSRLGPGGLLTWEFWTSLREMKDIPIFFHLVWLVEVAHLRQMPGPQLSHGIDICKFQHEPDSLRPYV